jgi:hypothetical protein
MKNESRHAVMTTSTQLELPTSGLPMQRRDGASTLGACSGYRGKAHEQPGVSRHS